MPEIKRQKNDEGIWEKMKGLSLAKAGIIEH